MLQAHVATQMSLPLAVVVKWWHRWKTEGFAGLVDRSPLCTDPRRRGSRCGGYGAAPDWSRCGLAGPGHPPPSLSGLELWACRRRPSHLCAHMEALGDETAATPSSTPSVGTTGSRPTVKPSGSTVPSLTNASTTTTSGQDLTVGADSKPGPTTTHSNGTTPPSQAHPPHPYNPYGHYT